MFSVPKVPNLIKHTDKHGFDMTYLFDRNSSDVLIVNMKTNKRISRNKSMKKTYKKTLENRMNTQIRWNKPFYQKRKPKFESTKTMRDDFRPRNAKNHPSFLTWIKERGEELGFLEEMRDKTCSSML